MTRQVIISAWDAVEVLQSMVPSLCLQRDIGYSTGLLTQEQIAQLGDMIAALREIERKAERATAEWNEKL